MHVVCASDFLNTLMHREIENTVYNIDILYTVYCIVHSTV